jgi:hypothetical protein
MTLGSEVPPEMTISIPAEIGLIERFARETLSLAAGRKGVATLLGPPV